MGIIERTYAEVTGEKLDEVLVSADSHVIEPAGLWVRELPASFRDRAPSFGGARANDSPGAMDKNERVKEMAADGVSAEVLYPTHGLRALSLDDPELEAACARVYNDWIVDYCSAAPDRLIGLGMLSMYDIESAILEMDRCRKLGLRGAIIWQVPPPEIPFTSDHYERFWAAAQDMDMPVNLHILSGHGYSKRRALDRDVPAPQPGVEVARTSVNDKLSQSVDALYDMIFSGVLERYPKLKLVIAENEIGWMPFVLEQWDYYYERHGNREGILIKKRPSEYFHEQMYATFFNDAVGGHSLSWWGEDNCMWSSDYPHGNSTWPNSHDVVARDLGALPAEKRAKLLRENVARLYNLDIPTPIQELV
jgi:predicted TIM-barrel fold metal-dependent hydrolase